MKIYSSSENDFSKNGYGFLKDCLSAKVNESLNGDDILELEYPVNGKLSEYLVEGNIIKTNVGNDNEQLFRIARVTKDFDEIQVYALHISYDLINNMLVDVYPQNLSCQAFGTWLLNHTQFTSPFTFYSDITASKTARYVRKNPIEAILGSADNSMVNLFGGELERDNFTLKFLSQRGNNNHVKLITGKNITEIQTKIDITTLYTRLMPIGFDGLILPEKFVDSPLINNYPTPRIGKVEFDNIKYDPNSTEEGVYTNIEDAYTALRNAANELFTQGIDKPKVSISVDWLELSKTEQYKNQFAYLERVNLGDTITANILGLDYTTRVVKTTYNVLTDTIDKFEIGTLESNITNTINNNQRKIEEINPSSILDQATQNATNLITSAMGGYVYKTNNELYIMDTDNPSTAQKVWRWNINGLGYSSTGINGPYGLAMTMDGAIVADFITTGVLNTNVIQGYDSLTLQVSTNTSDIATIKAEISDIADITTSTSSDVAFINSSELQNIAVSNPIRVEIHPINSNISYQYPNNGLFPSDTTYLKIRTLKFTNTSTNETFTYELPIDLLYYDADNYDTFVADYETDLVTITKKCGYNADGTTYLLNEPVITTYSYTETFAPHFELTQGNYQVELLGYNDGFIFVRLMVLNAYTAQYATKIELNSAVTQTAESITSEVNRKLENYSTTTEMNSAINQTATSITSSVSETYATKTTTNQLSSRISQTAKAISLSVNNGSTSSGITITTTKEDGTTSQATGTIKMNGLVSFTNLSTSGQTTINGANIQTGTITASKISTNAITTDKINANSITAAKIADTSITTAKINNGAITTAKIADAAITNAKIANLSANKITAGTLNASSISVTNITASNINRGTLSGANISIDNGTGFLRMLSGSAYNPYVSALNVSNKSNGISFRNSNSSGNAGSQIGTLHTEGTNLVMDATGNILIGGSSMSAGAIGIWSGYIHAGNMALGGNYLNANSGNLNLNTETWSAIYANGTMIGGYSSKKAKDNIKVLDAKEIETLYNEVNNLPSCYYDYKEKFGGQKDNYGFIIEDFKEDGILRKALHVINYKGIEKYSHDDLTQVNTILIKELMNKLEEQHKEIEILKQEIKSIKESD